MLLISLVAGLFQSVRSAFADEAPPSPFDSPITMGVPGFLLVGALVMFAAFLKGRKGPDGKNPRKVLAIASGACFALSVVMFAIPYMGYLDDLRKQDDYHRSRAAIYAEEQRQNEAERLPGHLQFEAHWAFERAFGEEQESKSREAIAKFDEAEKLNPDEFTPDSLVERGSAHIYLKEYELAVKDLLAATAKGKQCHAALAAAYLGLKQYQKAIDSANLASKEQTDYHFKPEVSRALANHGLGRDQKALKELNDLDRHMRTQDVIRARYRIYADMGNTAMALKDLKLLRAGRATLDADDLAYLEKYGATK